MDFDDFQTGKGGPMKPDNLKVKILGIVGMKSMGVRPTQLTENRKNRLAKLFRILTCQMCRPDTHALT